MPLRPAVGMLAAAALLLPATSCRRHENWSPLHGWATSSVLVVARFGQCHTEPEAAALKTDDSSALAAGCASSLDCSLNGDCDAVSGRCKCDAGWKGPGCASLDLAPQTAGAMLNETNMSTWGAPAVFAEGAYHAFVSEMVDGCGITSWQSNSQLTHYTARTPSGPWERKDIAVPLWAHCATVAVVPNKTGTTLIMTHMSRGAKARKCLASGCCEGGASPCGMKHPCNASRAAPTRGSVGAGEGHTDGKLAVKYAHSPDGPWLQTSVEVRNLSRFFLAAPLVLANGTAFMVVETPPLSTLLRAESWRGPYDVVTRAACGGGEGASIWADKAGRGLHCMYHRAPFNVSTKDGGHSFSPDGGISWWCARKGDGKHAPCHAAEEGAAESIPMYGSTVAFADGRQTSYGTRERPHAITGGDGALVAVSSSLELCAPLSPVGGPGAWSHPGPYSQCTNRWPGYNDRTWTSILPVKSDDVHLPDPFWRNDSANLALVAAWDSYLAATPLSDDVTSTAVSDEPPVKLSWSLGAEMPHGQKDGCSCFIGHELVTQGGGFGDAPWSTPSNVNKSSPAFNPLYI